MNRRTFVGSLLTGIAGVAGMGFQLPVARRLASDIVTLNKSGIRVSRLGMGTGSFSGAHQRQLGQEGFTRMLRYGVDQGLTFIDTADNYGGIHEMIREAIKGLDRSKIQIQTKISDGKYNDPLKEIDRFRKEVGTDYFDIGLFHFAHTGDWVEKGGALMDALDEAKHRGWIKANGVSIHGMEALAAALPVTWGDIRMVRINHDGTAMDMDDPRDAKQRQTVIDSFKRMHAEGKGMIGMKLIGNGTYVEPERREQSIRYVMGLDFIDAVVIGFKSTDEIDEAITRINAALNA